MNFINFTILKKRKEFVSLGGKEKEQELNSIIESTEHAHLQDIAIIIKMV
jgi:hypothetical protein